MGGLSDSCEQYPDQQHDGQRAAPNNRDPKPEIIAHAVKL
jgi:hypothetical protein